ncbi:MAG: hypothetical protein ABSG73_15430 [Candidatus Aminicenantales bacterium]
MVLALVVGVTISSPLSATDVYKALMLTGKPPVEPATVRIRVEIQEYTTAEDVIRLQETLNNAGTNAFLKAFTDMKKGVVRIMDSRGWNLPVHAAQVIPTKKGRKLQCFMLREAWNQETQIVRQADLFMVLELNLNEKGMGDGRLYQDAGIDLQPQTGRIEMTKFGSAPKVLFQASAEKKKS